MPVNAFVNWPLPTLADVKVHRRYADARNLASSLIGRSWGSGRFSATRHQTITSSFTGRLKSIDLQSAELRVHRAAVHELQFAPSCNPPGSCSRRSCIHRSCSPRAASPPSWQSAELPVHELQSHLCSELLAELPVRPRLQSAELQSAEMQSVVMQSTELQSAELQSAELQSAELQSAFKEPSADDKFMESSVVDELLSIISTPRSSATLDTIDFQQSDYMSLEEIFNSISSLD
ncbi:hypothetical protein AGLY_014685 [Aphis glycines]|uniref:Uncharacterized protein n=1 Tax=Aphis glycines TaxID=307491 RepID=A0A6G0T2R4_APHGL|nr:hypothetical protein AGLY_014685 [Aphis glycines]